MVIVAEIGINHNGDINTAQQLISAAKLAGCDAVKFQKRTIDTVYTQEELDKPRESPWGTTNRAQKLGLEFDKEEYDEIDDYCRLMGTPWFASPWDVDSATFLSHYDIPWVKIASPCITDMELLEAVKLLRRPVILSTGMSTRPEVMRAIDVLGSAVEYVLACTSTYPAPAAQMNLRFITELKQDPDFKRFKIGFSNHSPGITFCVAAAALGAEMIEFHLTLDRAMYGSDQAASIELPGATSIVKHCRSIERGLGTGQWTVYGSEILARNKLRRYL